MPLALQGIEALFQQTEVKSGLTELVQRRVNISATGLVGLRQEEQARRTAINLFRDLNLSLVRLKQRVNVLSDQGLTSASSGLGTSQNEQTALTSLAFGLENQVVLPRLVSASAQELSGNPNATAFTRFIEPGGSLSVGGVEVVSERGATKLSLAEIARRINATAATDAVAKIIDDRLVLFSTAQRDALVSDRLRFGAPALQLSAVEPLSNRQIRQILGLTTNDRTLRAAVRFQSFSAEKITGVAGADGDTPLHKVTGTLKVNGVLVLVGSGSTDTLNSLARRISQVASGVSASVQSGRLVLTGTGGDLTVEDRTTGGTVFDLGLGLSRTADADTAEPFPGAFLNEQTLQIISVAQRKHIVSFSAREITGNAEAAEKTPLGLSGTVEIDGVTIPLFSSQSLEDLQMIFSRLLENVEVRLTGDVLQLRARNNRVDFTVEDNSTGGATGGLGLRRQSDVATALPITLIQGNPSDTELSLLTLTGEIVLDISGPATFQVRLTLGEPNATDTLQNLAREIVTQVQQHPSNPTNTAFVSATAAGGRLVISAAGGASVRVTDLTEGGLGNTTAGFGFSDNLAEAARPQGSFVLQDGRPLLAPTQGLSSLFGVDVVVHHNSVDASRVQVTFFNARLNIRQSVIEAARAFNDALAKLDNLLAFVETRGAFHRNLDLARLRDNLVASLKKHEDSLKEIGIRLEEGFSADASPRLRVHDEELQRNIRRFPAKVLAPFRGPEGIGRLLDAILGDIIPSNGIPGVNFLDTRRFGTPRREEIGISPGGSLAAAGFLDLSA